MTDNQLFDGNAADHFQFGFHSAEPSYSFGNQNSQVFGHDLPSSGANQDGKFTTIDFEDGSFSNSNPTVHPVNQSIKFAEIQDSMALNVGAVGPGFDTKPSITEESMAAWHAANPLPDSQFRLGAGPFPSSAHSEFASQRVGTVHRFGEVTPSDEVAKSRAGLPPERTTSSSEEADAQRQRQERARNAAHTRHARNSSNRNPRRDSLGNENLNGGGEGDGAIGDKREKYREKNRLAAAKCRSKKKASVGDLEERHRIMAAENNFRRREERELRDQLTTLRTMALEHGPDRCRCGDVHLYNQAKATEMAFGRRFGGDPVKTTASPSSESTSSFVSSLPELAPKVDGRHASLKGAVDADAMNRSTEVRSSTMESPSDAGHDGLMANELPHDSMFCFDHSQDDFPMFANFLQNSPTGRRPGFA